jgi:hypothetical protein
VSANRPDSPWPGEILTQSFADHMLSRVSIWRGLLAGTICALGSVGSAQAATGTLTGSVGGLPSGASAEVVEAVNPQGVIGGVGTVSAAGTYTLTLSPGTWLVTGSALSGDTALTATSAPVGVRARHRTHGPQAHLKSMAAVVKRGLPPGSVVTVAPILLADERGPVFNLKPDYTGLVTNDLFAHCASRGIIFVDTSEAFRKFAQQELALSRAGRLATPFDYRPIAPQYRIEVTSNEVDRAGIMFGLSVHKPGDTETDFSDLEASGEVNITGPQIETGPTDEEVVDLVNQEAGALAEKICG